jgi:hypothetical protein
VYTLLLRPHVKGCPNDRRGGVCVHVRVGVCGGGGGWRGGGALLRELEPNVLLRSGWGAWVFRKGAGECAQNALLALKNSGYTNFHRLSFRGVVV